MIEVSAHPITWRVSRFHWSAGLAMCYIERVGDGRKFHDVVVSLLLFDLYLYEQEDRGELYE